MYRRPPNVFCFLLLLTTLAVAARAQSVRWEPAGGSLAAGQTSELSLIFADCEPEGEVTLPAVPGLTFGRPTRGEQSSFTVVNGQATRTRTVYLTYSVRPEAVPSVRIPGFTVRTDEGNLPVLGVSFEVGEATVGGSPLAAAASSLVTVGEGPVWAGQVVPVSYTLSVSDRFNAQLGGSPEWDSSPLVLEEWSRPEPFRGVVNGETRANVLYTTRGYIREPGAYTLDAINQLVNLRVPASGFSIFQSFQARQFTITSNRPALTVRPLPQPAPAAFAGAVGEFTLTSKVVPATATVSEPITWTIELGGTGNWPDISGLPSREASSDFRVVQPQPRRTNSEGSLFDSLLTEDVVLIPTRPGVYTLEPVVWHYFDPTTGTYKTLSTERVTVTVTSPPADPSNPAAGTSAPAPLRVDVPGTEPAPAPAAPTAIPLDPLPGIATAPVPWSRGTLIGALIGTVAWLPLCWLALSWHRARQLDPLRPRREARLRLARTLAALASAREPARLRALLRQWQHDTAALWGVNRAAPTSALFAADPVWTALWTEAERVVYGPDDALPTDWLNRAGSALATRRVPGFSPAAAFLRRNLFPFTAALALVLTAPSAGGADAGVAAYNGSEFSAAEKIWREALGRRPTDWIAHHNLALALAQQDRWGEAAGHATAAFVQNPAHPSVRWHLGLTLDRARYSPPALAAFVRPGQVHILARLLSPARWQQVLVGSVFLVALSLALLLLRAYGNPGRWLRPVAVAMVMAALLLAAASGISLRTYGLATDARTALVWRQTTLRSIPTEADTAQKTSSLAAGSLAIINHSFLGWSRLAFPDGQTGWVRHEDVIRLYR